MMDDNCTNNTHDICNSTGFHTSELDLQNTTSTQWKTFFYWQWILDGYFGLGVLTVILNAIVVLCFALKPQQLLKDGYHTLGMSISDAVAGLIVCIYFKFFGHFMAFEWCCLINIAFATSQTATILQLLVICIERFNIFRTVGSSMTVRKVQHPKIILFAWAFSIFMSTWPVFVFGQRPTGNFRCSFIFLWGSNFGSMGTYYAAMYSIPLGVINLFYVGALIYLKQRLNKINANATNDATQSTQFPNPASTTLQTENTLITTQAHLSVPKQVSTGGSDTVEAVPSVSDGQSRESNSPTVTNPCTGASKGLVTVQFKQTRKQMQRKVFITFGLLLLVLNIVSLPRLVIVVMKKRSTEFADNFRLFLISFNCLNSFFNPIVYAFRLEVLRGVFVQEIHKLKKFVLRR